MMGGRASPTGNSLLAAGVWVLSPEDQDQESFVRRTASVPRWRV